MPVRLVRGDPLLTTAQTLAFGHNARGRTEQSAIVTTLMQRYPAAFSQQRKQARSGKLRPGDIYIYRDSTPALAFLIVRLSAAGATRYRHVQAAALVLARDYRYHMLESVAIAPLGTHEEWPMLISVLRELLEPSPLHVTIYERYLPGVNGERA